MRFENSYNPLEERIDWEIIKVKVDEITKLIGISDKPNLLFNAIGRQRVILSSSLIRNYYNGVSKTVPKRIEDYLIRLKDKIQNNENVTSIDYRGLLEIKCNEFEIAYNMVVGAYSLSDNKVNELLKKRKLNIGEKKINELLRRVDLNGYNPKETIKFLNWLGKIRNVEYSLEKDYKIGDLLYIKGLGLGEVIDGPEATMILVDFGHIKMPMKSAFKQMNG